MNRIMLGEKHINIINDGEFFDEIKIEKIVKEFVKNNILDNYVNTVKVVSNTSWETKYEYNTKTIFIKNDLNNEISPLEHNLDILVNIVHELIHVMQFNFLENLNYQLHPGLYFRLFESIYSKHRLTYDQYILFSLSEYQSYCGSIAIALKILSKINSLESNYLYKLYLKAIKNLIMNGYTSFEKPYLLKNPIENSPLFNSSDLDYYKMFNKEIDKIYQQHGQNFDLYTESNYLDFETSLLLGYHLTAEEFNNIFQDDKILIKTNNTPMI